MRLIKENLRIYAVKLSGVNLEKFTLVEKYNWEKL